MASFLYGAFGGNGVVPVSPIKLATRYDDFSQNNISYLGKAEIGSLPANSVWQIAKIDFTQGVVVTYANGVGDFNQSWDNRLSLGYS